MKEDFSDIDKLFREELSQAAFNPPPGVWESVSAGISAQGAAVTTAAATKSGLLTVLKSYWLWLAVAGIATVVVLNTNPDAKVGETENKVEQRSKQSGEEVTVLPDNGVTTDNSETDNTLSAGASDNNRIENSRPENSNRPAASESGSSNQESRDKSISEPKNPVSIIPHHPHHEPVKNNSPATGNPQVRVKECPHSLVIQAEMISNRLVSFKASGFTGPVKWDFGDGHLSSGLQTQHEYKDETSNYIVKSYSTSINGCTDSALYPVSVIGSEAHALFVPDYLTPNGDGLNDELKIEIGAVKDYNLIIFDSNNRPVFTTSNPNISWNGKSGIRDCDAGAYNLVLSYRLKDSNQSQVVRKRILLKR